MRDTADISLKCFYVALQFEAKVVLAKLIQTFEMKLVPNTKIEIAETGTLRPKGGVPVTLTCKRVS